MIKLSIILPCYNVSKYLKRCLESIYSQPFSYPFEVIAVNDSSTDDTLNVLYKLSKVYPNIIVVNKEVNGKLTSARSAGIKIATGEYIMHIDPDDYLLPNTLNVIFQNGIDWDILFTNIQCLQSNQIDSYTIYKINQKKIFDLSLKKDRKALFKTIKGSCFAKVIKSSLCRNLIYSEYHYNMGEDFAFNFEVFNRASRVLYQPIIMYSYQFNPESLYRAKFNADRLDIKDSWVSNVRQVINSSVSIYPESRKEIIKSIERYSIGLLLQIRKESEKDRLILLNKWKRFFSSQLDIYGHTKQLWYRYLLSIESQYIYILLFVISLGQLSPIIERVKRLFKVYN